MVHNWQLPTRPGEKLAGVELDWLSKAGQAGLGKDAGR